MGLKNWIVLILVALAVNVSAIERERFGIGVNLGQPTGIAAKYMIDHKHAVDAGIGWELSNENDLHIYADYLFHYYDIFEISKGSLPLYYGTGIRWIYRGDRDNKLGFRIPVGLEYLFEDASWGAFLELVPVLNVTQGTDLFDWEGGVGIRYFF
jgi:hypothetical protein